MTPSLKYKETGQKLNAPAERGSQKANEWISIRETRRCTTDQAQGLLPLLRRKSSLLGYPIIVQLFIQAQEYGIQMSEKIMAFATVTAGGVGIARRKQASDT